MELPFNIIPCTTEEYPTPAARPMNSILENRNLKERGIDIMTNWKSDIDKFVLNFREVLLKDIEKET
jgi:dTDP-4-dehydrorhamnose reductase